MPSATRTVYVGAYTSGESEGIYRFRLNLDTGALDMVGLAAPSEGPSFLALHPRQPILYTANGLMAFEDHGKYGRTDANKKTPRNRRFRLFPRAFWVACPGGFEPPAF